MKLRPLVINELALKEIRRVKEYAELNRRSLHRQFNEKRAGGKVPGDDPGHVCILPVGYRCVFSIDEEGAKQGEDQGHWFRHLSISLMDPNPKLMPNEFAVGELMKGFGFRAEFPIKDKAQWESSKCGFWIETIQEHKAINVIEEIQ